MTLYFQLKDEAQLALKRMPASEQEALFMLRESVLCLFFSTQTLFFFLKQARCILHICESYASFYLDHVNINDMASKQIS